MPELPTATLFIAASNPFGHEARLVGAFALDHDIPGGLHAAFDFLQCLEREAPAYPRASRHRTGKAQTIEAVVDAHPGTREADRAPQQEAQHGSGEKTVRHSGLERGLAAG